MIRRLVTTLLVVCLSTAALGREYRQAELATQALQRQEGSPAPTWELLPPPPVGGDFPALPPDPHMDERSALPSLDEELSFHGGSYLYLPEGDHGFLRAQASQSTSGHASSGPAHRNHLLPNHALPNHALPNHALSNHDQAGHADDWRGQHFAPFEHGRDEHVEYLRLPEWWQRPRPLTLFTDFLGSGPIRLRGSWPGAAGYAWEPRFVLSGGYEFFGLGIHENDDDLAAVGQQLILNFDLRLTGTERFHVQMRPLGREGTGGSYYQFTHPDGYVDNSVAEPQRYWFEGELHSILGGYLNPFAVRDVHFVAGKFPLAFQNFLLLNDEVLGVVVNKNNLRLGSLSNLNVQGFYLPNDVDAFDDGDAQLYGTNITADYLRQFYEFTYAFLQHESDSGRNAHFFGASRTQLYGPTTVALRALFKWGDRAGRGSGQLFVVEANRTRVFEQARCGITHGVFYLNGFGATKGWNGISGGNFNRLTSSFAVNPLVTIAAGLDPDDRWGIAGGVQLFRHHEDEALLPEFAFESRQGTPVVGLGLRYQRKLTPRTYLQVLGIANESKESSFDRYGAFTSWFWLL